MHASSFHNAHSCMPNVCDNNVYEAQTCASFYLLIVLISVQDDMALRKYFKLKDELPVPRGPLTTNIPSHAIVHFNQKV